jgi:hypothetical protein
MPYIRILVAFTALMYAFPARRSGDQRAAP